jgi:hypothetical protein
VTGSLLVIVVGTALLFDFTNGFHDSANANRDLDLHARAPAGRRAGNGVRTTCSR